MTELDLEFPELAAELIDEFGKEVAYSISANAVYDPAVGNVVAISDNRTIKAIIEPDKGQAVRAGLAEGADYKLTIAADGLDYSTEDIITFDGVDYKVKLVKDYFSGELKALHELYVKR